MNHSTNYYDIDVDKFIDKSCCIDDCFYLKDLKQRKITEKEYSKKYRVEWYMYADEAKKNGFVDYIIGEDCSLDDII